MCTRFTPQFYKTGLPLVALAALWVTLCRTEISAGCPFGRGYQSTAMLRPQHRQKMESILEGNTWNLSDKKIRSDPIFNHLYLLEEQTFVIWSASGRTFGETLSNILTCSRTSSGTLLSRDGLILLSYRFNSYVKTNTEK